MSKSLRGRASVLQARLSNRKDGQIFTCRGRTKNAPTTIFLDRSERYRAKWDPAFYDSTETNNSASHDTHKSYNSLACSAAPMPCHSREDWKSGGLGPFLFHRRGQLVRLRHALQRRKRGTVLDKCRPPILCTKYLGNWREWGNTFMVTPAQCWEYGHGMIKHISWTCSLHQIRSWSRHRYLSLGESVWLAVHPRTLVRRATTHPTVLQPLL